MPWHAIDSIEPSINKTKEFFKGPGLFAKWLKLSVLVFIFSLFSGGGGGGGGSYSGGGGGGGSGADSPGFNELPSKIQEWVGSIPGETWAMAGFLILIGIIIIFLLGIVFAIIRNMCFFSILESINLNDAKIWAYWKKFYGKSVSLMLVQLVFGIISGILLLLMVIAGLSVFFGVFGIQSSVLGGFSGIVLGVTAAILILLAAIPLLVVMAIANYVLGQFASYWMYVKDMSAWQAFKKSLSLVKSNLSQVIVLIFTQLFLGIILAVIAVIAFLIILLPVAIIGIALAIILVPLISSSPALLIPIILFAIIGIIILSFVVTFIITPVHVFFFNYNLLVLRKLLGIEKPAPKGEKK